MKSLLISFVTLLATASCQSHTKLQDDGYHYDRPQVRLNIPEVKPSCPNGAKLPFCCENGAENDACAIPTPPPPPAFFPKINLPSIIRLKPTEAPVTQKSLLVDSQKPPPLPAFIPKFNFPSIIPVKPTSVPQTKRPIPPFPPIINLPPVIPVKTTKAPAPFVPRSQMTESPNEYLPPVEEQEDEWEAWKSKFNKRYASEEEDARRRIIFFENVNAINLHNEDYAAGRVTFDMDKNKFSDLLQDEFIKFHTGIRGKRKSSQQSGYDYPVPTGESYVSKEIGGQVSFISQDGSSKSSISYKSSKDGSSISVQSSSSSLPVSPKSSNLPVSPKEFASSAQGQNMTNVFMPSSLLEDQAEDEVDWRKKGAVTAVKNQGKCASCWAFAANGALESQNFLRKQKGPIPLSEQNLIDCVKDNDGCDGGYMTHAYEYVRRNKGVDTEASYPYEERDDKQCRFKRSDVGGECTTFMEIQIGNEEALRQAVATVGPVAAGIDGAKRSFQFYKSGYYYEPKCEQDVNHAVLIVGYGKTDKGEEYWIGKNSWDTDWGEAGYIKMAKNRGNHCGIANLASYPLV